MAVDWQYSLQFYFSQIFSSSGPFDLITLVSLSVSGIFLIGIIHALYLNYKKNKLVETLFFLVGMICLIIGAVSAILVRFCYENWGLRGLGDLLSIIMSIIILICIVLVNLFSIRVTFPRRYKILLAILLVLSTFMVFTGVWATVQGPPHSRVIDFGLVFSLEFMLIRFFGLVPFSVIPISLFFYYAKKVREEQRAHSNRSIWLGLGILCFATTILVATANPTFQVIQVLYVPAAIIFYVCFSMPNWFKRKIGWID
ncbi:MAG: hypothetical protein HWN67_15625 [Candidatus Helarchaeota archaeon]|nr:hypothetical protein [Candidatus Helarchaeota archaeon]